MSNILKVFMMLLLATACSPKEEKDQLTITDKEGNKVVYSVELAQTKEELTTGLMNRTTLDADSGMIFDLSSFDKVPTAMWMKDTPLALDMIFIDRDGMIFWVYENAQPNSTQLIVAPYAATAVLEVNAGDIKAKGLKIGDTVDHKLFSKVVSDQNAEQNTATDESEEVVVEETENEEITVEEDKEAEPEEETISEEKTAEAEVVEEEKDVAKE